MKINLLARFIVGTFVLFTIAASPRLMAQEFTNHVYQAIEATLTWHEAKTNAELRGGHLATFTSQAEYDYVRNLGVLPAQGYWLGATDEAQEGVFVWVTGEPWGFTAWRAGEPNNNFNNEDYVLSSAGDGHFWNDFGTAASTQPFYLLEIDFCSPHRATATAQVTNGFVVGAIITDPGCGYTNAPSVLIQGGGGTGAAATAVLTDGRVTAINFTSAGCCYTNAPQIVIDLPPFVPRVGIRVSKVKVLQNVGVGRWYVLESSTNISSWTATGPPFIAESELIESEFDVDVTGRFFRLREVAPP